MWSVEAVAAQLAKGKGGQIETCSVAEPKAAISIYVFNPGRPNRISWNRTV
jgi:hypothetical protein